MKNNVTSNIVRYVRPVILIDNGLPDITTDNLGGCAIVYNILHDEKKIEFNFSVCSVDDNFDKKLGTKLASDNLSLFKFVADYDSKEPLDENLYNYVTTFEKIPHNLSKQNVNRLKSLRDMMMYCYGTMVETDQIMNDFSIYSEDQELIRSIKNK